MSRVSLPRYSPGETIQRTLESILGVEFCLLTTTQDNMLIIRHLQFKKLEMLPSAHPRFSQDFANKLHHSYHSFWNEFNHPELLWTCLFVWNKFEGIKKPSMVWQNSN